jgi:hypothetical protein
MGLLDDAIREHLELKRRSGADPGEVAREQQEALEPVFPGEAANADGDAGLPVEPVAGEADEIPPAGVAPDPPPAGPPEAGSADGLSSPERSSTGQETVELDMQSVLDADVEPPARASPAGLGSAGPERGAVASEPEADSSDSLEWEMPGEGRDEQDESVADRRRRWASEEQSNREESPGGPEDRPDVPAQVPGQERLSFE